MIQLDLKDFLLSFKKFDVSLTTENSEASGRNKSFIIIIAVSVHGAADTPSRRNRYEHGRIEQSSYAMCDVLQNEDEE